MLVGLGNMSLKSYSTFPSIPVELNPVIYVPDIKKTSFAFGRTFVAAKRIFEDFFRFDVFYDALSSSRKSFKSIVIIEAYA